MTILNETKTELVTKTETISVVQGQEEEKMGYEEMLSKMLNALVAAQSKISLNSQTLLKIDSNVMKNLSDLTKTLCDIADRETADEAKKEIDQIDAQAANTVFGILGAILGCIFGFLFGGVGGLIVSAVLAALSLTGALDKAVTWLAQKISGQDNPPAWLKGLIGVIFTICVAAAGAAVTGGINLIAQNLLPKVFSSVAEAGANAASQVAKEGVEEAVEQTSVSTLTKVGATTMFKMIILQTLASTNALSNLISGVLEECGVDKETAEIVGAILATLILLAAGFGMMKGDAVMSNLFQGSARFGTITRLTSIATALSMIGSGITDIFSGVYKLDLADIKDKYAYVNATMNQTTNMINNFTSAETMKAIQAIEQSFAEIFSGISSYKAAKERVFLDLGA